MTDPNSQPLTPVKAIRAYCLNCCCESETEVKLCPAMDCQLWPFRMGKNPNRKGRAFTEEERKSNYYALVRFKLSEAVDNPMNSELEELRNAISHPNGGYPVFGDFPGENRN